MDRLNEMHLEDPSSEHDLYNMGRRGPMEADVFDFDGRVESVRFFGNGEDLVYRLSNSWIQLSLLLKALATLLLLK